MTCLRVYWVQGLSRFSTTDPAAFRGGGVARLGEACKPGAVVVASLTFCAIRTRSSEAAKSSSMRLIVSDFAMASNRIAYAALGRPRKCSQAIKSRDPDVSCRLPHRGNVKSHKQIPATLASLSRACNQKAARLRFRSRGRSTVSRFLRPGTQEIKQLSALQIQAGMC